MTPTTREEDPYGLLIMRWEYEELLEHLEGREDIWKRNEENPLLWLRIDDEGQAGCALSFSEELEGEFPIRQVDVYPIVWPPHSCRDYLDELLTFWTEYYRRIQFTKTLQERHNMKEGDSQLAAMRLAAIDHETGRKDPDPEGREEPAYPHGFLPPTAVPDPDHIGIWDVKAGLPSQAGTLWLRRARHNPNQMISIEVSLPSPTGGHVPRLTGFVYPVSGNVKDFTYRIRGEEGQDASPTDCPESVF